MSLIASHEYIYFECESILIIVRRPLGPPYTLPHKNKLRGRVDVVRRGDDVADDGASASIEGAFVTR
jgi:hypothetical protein